jgi:hypothetical protein
MKAAQLARYALFAATVVASSLTASGQSQSTTCSKDRDFIAFISSELEKKWHLRPRRITASDKDCIEWSNESTLPRDWFSEITERYYAGLAPPVGAITGTAEQNAKLKQALQEAAIAFSTKQQDKTEWIFWDDRDNDRARLVVKRVWGRDITPPTADDRAALAEARKSWPIDEKRASAIVLDAYPELSSNIYILAPAVATFSSRPLAGFENAGKYAWAVLVICNSGGMHAQFFVNPINGALVATTKPGDKDSAQCT